MPTPTLITDLSTTAASNFPQGSDSPSNLDDVQRAHGAFIAQLRDGTGFTGGALPIAGGGTGATTAAAARTALGASTVGSSVFTAADAAAARTAIGAASGTGSASGTNTGDQTNISGNAGTVTNGVYTTTFTSNQSLGSSGYQKLPGGLILQWGIGSASSAVSGTSTSITLPIAYPSGLLVALAGPTGTAASNSTFNVTSISASGFTVQRGNNGNAESGVNFHWFSLGM